MEYENGILAMEFAAPAPGEAMLQLDREPVGPYLAAGNPSDFDWDEKTGRVRYKYRPGKGRRTGCGWVWRSRSRKCRRFSTMRAVW